MITLSSQYADRVVTELAWGVHTVGGEADQQAGLAVSIVAVIEISLALIRLRV
jgi:hypothetical protein